MTLEPVPVQGNSLNYYDLVLGLGAYARKKYVVSRQNKLNTDAKWTNLLRDDSGSLS
jgi:hypothetical protein